LFGGACVPDVELRCGGSARNIFLGGDHQEDGVVTISDFGAPIGRWISGRNTLPSEELLRIRLRMIGHHRQDNLVMHNATHTHRLNFNKSLIRQSFAQDFQFIDKSTTKAKEYKTE
jgi:hypothetical protein